MDIRREAKSGSSPSAGCNWFCDAADIHKNLLPYGLRIFLAQRKIFLVRRIALDKPSSEIIFELPKIFRNAPIVNF